MYCPETDDGGFTAGSWLLPEIPPPSVPESEFPHLLRTSGHPTDAGTSRRASRVSVPGDGSPDATDTRQMIATQTDNTLSDITSAPWHEAHLVTDYDRERGYEPCEELAERSYADLIACLAKYGPDPASWPRKWRRGAWPGPPCNVRIRKIFWLAQRDGGLRCRYCSRGMRASTATIDHLTPTERGGTNDRSNLGLACLWCNSKKGLTEAEYLQALAEAA